jgi:murein L,D-transpeptidase YafK
MHLLLSFLLMVTPNSFKEKQLTFNHVKIAYDEKYETIKGYFKDGALTFDGFEMFIRAFKEEGEVEVWVKEKDQSAYSLLHTYPICASSGLPGPKRREGDLQVPEGIYHINHFNPLSNYFLSLGISYPNASDKLLSDKQHPGGSIYIHGNCVTVGCIPVTDDKIKELYVLAVEARNNGQENIPIHIFPRRFNLSPINANNDNLHLEFWQNLETIYNDFEKTKMLRLVSVNNRGAYLLK